MQRTKTSWKQGILISLVVVVAMLLIFEGYLRFTFEVHDPGEGACATYSDTLLWSTKPNCGGSNNHGYRDYNHTLEKPEDTFRIVIIGDSVVFGHLVDELDDTFGKVLEKNLNENEEKKFETIHLARSGYTTTQEMHLLREEAFDYEPDLIILNYILNDPLNPVYHPISFNEPRYGYQSQWYQPTSHVVSFAKKKLFFIKEKWKAKDCPEEYHTFLHCAYRDEVRDNFEEMGEISFEKDVPIIFVINPIFHGGAYKQYGLTGLHKQIGDLAKSEGLVVYDILDVFKQYEVGEVGVCQGQACDVWHPSKEGHKVIADYLYEKLKEDNYV